MFHSSFKYLLFLLLSFLLLGLWLASPSEATTGTVYYVAMDGNDSNLGTQVQPFRTIKKGLGIMNSGDTLIVKGGTYPEYIDRDNIPSGTSWTNATTIKAAPNETVILRPTSNAAAGSVVWFGSQKYIIFDGFVVDAADVTVGIRFQATNTGERTVHHIRVQNCEIKNAPGTYGVGHTLREAGGHHLEIINCNIHDNGTRLHQDHGIYLPGQDNLIERNLIHDNASHGVHVFWDTNDCDRTIVRNNRSYNNGSWGILIGCGDNVQAYNNIVWNNGFKRGISGGMRVGYASPTNNKIYNNTIYGNNTDCIRVNNESSGTIVANNLCWQNGSNKALNQGAGSSISNNLFTDPKFVNAAADDFHLQSGSPAINAGMTLSEVLTDFDGIARPQGTAYDIGAYEFGRASPTSPTLAQPTTPLSRIPTGNCLQPSVSLPPPGNNIPSPVCLGSCPTIMPTPTIPAGCLTTPSVGTIITDPISQTAATTITVPTIIQPTGGGGGGGGGSNNIIEIFLQLIQLIIQLILKLFTGMG